MSERSMQLNRNRSQSEGNSGEEIKDVRPMLSCVTGLGWQIEGCNKESI